MGLGWQNNVNAVRLFVDPEAFLSSRTADDKSASALSSSYRRSSNNRLEALEKGLRAIGSSNKGDRQKAAANKIMCVCIGGRSCRVGKSCRDEEGTEVEVVVDRVLGTICAAPWTGLSTNNGKRVPLVRWSVRIMCCWLLFFAGLSCAWGGV